MVCNVWIWCLSITFGQMWQLLAPPDVALSSSVLLQLGVMVEPDLQGL